MRNILLTTALAMPLSLVPAFAQQTQTEAPAPAEAQVPETEGAEADAAADQAADAVSEAVEETGQAIEEGAEAAGAAVEGAAETVETEVTEGAAEVEAEVTTEPAEATTEPQAADVEVIEAEPAEGTAASSEVLAREQAPNELRLDWITGTNVTSPDGEAIGDINDLIMDGETGQVTAAIIGVGGFLGIGQKQIAINWDELQIDYDANEITTDLTREEAEAAPEYVFRQQEPAPAPVETAPAPGAVGTEPAPGAGGMTAPAPGTAVGTPPAGTEPAAPAN